MPEEQPSPGFRGWLWSVDNVRVGVLWLAAALLFFLFGGLAAILLRAELTFPGATWITPEDYAALFTLHGTFMVFFFAVVVFFGIGSIIVPTLIGARQMAFHRLNTFDLWLIVLGGLVLEIGYLAGERPLAGWTSYAPLALAEHSPGRGQDWWAWAVLIETLGGTLAGANFLVTILRERAPGVRLRDLPVVAWTFLFASVLVLVAGPFLLVALSFQLLDRNVGTLFFSATTASGPILWQDLFWFYSHPATYVMVVPAFGVVTAVVARFGGRRLFSRFAIVAAAAVVTTLAFMVWWHHMFTTGIHLGPRIAAALATWGIAIPTGVIVFAWLASLRRGAVRMTTPMLFALGFILMFTVGGANGVYLAFIPFDVYAHDTYWLVAHIHYVIFGGTVLGLFAGLYYWFPAALHRALDERLGRWHFWGTLVGMNLTFFPMHVLGLLGQPRRTWDMPAEHFGLNMVITTGMFLVAAATLVFVVNVAATLAHAPRVADDPWGAEAPDA